MIHVSKIAAVAVSAAALGIVIGGCQPQSGPAATAEAPAAAEATTTAADATADVMPPDELTAAEISALFVGNTVFGQLDSWKLTWAEYFAPDGTAKALLRFEGQADLNLVGKHYANDRDEFCTEYKELPDQQIFCHKLIVLADGLHQQVYADGTKGGIYKQILEGEQIDAFK